MLQETLLRASLLSQATLVTHYASLSASCNSLMYNNTDD